MNRDAIIPNFKLLTITFLTLVLLTSLVFLTACAPQSKPVLNQEAPSTSGQPAAATPTTLQPAITHTPTPFMVDGPLSVVFFIPAESEIIASSPLVITGKADAGTVISINNEIILVGEGGEFSFQLDLQPGTNLIEVTASDAQNNQEFSYLSLIYEPLP